MRTRALRYSVRLILRDVALWSISLRRSSGIENEQGLLLGLRIDAKNKIYKKPVKKYLKLLISMRELPSLFQPIKSINSSQPSPSS